MCLQFLHPIAGCLEKVSIFNIQPITIKMPNVVYLNNTTLLKIHIINQKKPLSYMSLSL